MTEYMSKPIISLIAAIGKNRELGAGGTLPWNVPEDLKFFKKQTVGKPIIMGRKTYDSIGRALPNRTNIVVTRNKDFKADGIVVVESVDAAIMAAAEENPDEIMIIGGAQIFDLVMATANKLYLTIIDSEFEADTYFPAYDMFNKELSRHELETDDYRLTFLELGK